MRILAIFQSSIVWSALIGFVFLKEKIHWLDLVSIPFTLAGIILIAKPPIIFGNGSYSSESAVGLMFGLTCAILVGLLVRVLNFRVLSLTQFTKS